MFNNLRPKGIVAQQGMLEHLGIAREEIVVRECLQEGCVDDDEAGTTERAHLVLQSVEVDPCLTARTGIDHCEERRGHVDIVDASLERTSHKATEVGHHAAAQIDEARMARCPELAQLLPYVGGSGNGLVVVAGRNGDELRLSQTEEIAH